MKRRNQGSRTSAYRGFLLGSVAGFLLFAAISGLYAWRTLPDVQILKTSYPVVRYQGPEKPTLVSLQRWRPRNWVGLDEISPIGVRAIVISEDWAFFQHHGYDVNQIKEAIQADWDRKTFARGASTITQQVVRNVFLTKDKNIWRKAKELYLAVKLDEAVSKRKVLETYLNIAEWGPGIYGIGDASVYYFQKNPKDLTAKEGAFLAMLLPSPIRYGQSFRSRELTDYANETIQSILDKLTQAHYLTEEEKNAEWNRPLSFELLRTANLKSGSI